MPRYGETLLLHGVSVYKTSTQMREMSILDHLTCRYSFSLHDQLTWKCFHDGKLQEAINIDTLKESDHMNDNDLATLHGFRTTFH